jgi:hypothetical protein
MTVNYYGICFITLAPGGQSSDLHLNVGNFSTTVLIRLLRQLKAAVLLHWCLICAVLIDSLGVVYRLDKQ